MLGRFVDYRALVSLTVPLGSGGGVARWDSHRFGGFMPSGDPILAVTEALESNCDKLLKTPARKTPLCMGARDKPRHDNSTPSESRPNEAIDLGGIDQVWVAPCRRILRSRFHLLEHGYSTPKGLHKSNDRRRSDVKLG